MTPWEVTGRGVNYPRGRVLLSWEPRGHSMSKSKDFPSESRSNTAGNSLGENLTDAIEAAFGAASLANDLTTDHSMGSTAGFGTSETLAQSSTLQTGQTVGRYKLIRPIGEGGMGAVWLAEQEKPIRRQVALKLIKAGVADKQTIARFEAERQALSMMDHPHIAKVLDAGATPAGSPYFVMELVKGEPVTQYCDANKLSLNERLALFIQACEAVQHAHHKGIIHRDLKPSNILVHIHNDQHTVKVIDFGLAKALDQQAKLTDKTVHTEFGRVMGTLQYMSPEQAQLDSLDIDTRTDVYSLGIILYELLAGSTPIDKESLKEKTLLQVLEMVREETPPLPSNRLSSSFDKLDSISSMRQIQSGKLQQILKGELDWVVMRALEKDRARRYATPIDFAADVRRYLDGDAVVARPPSVSYRFRKFVRKNWIPVGVVAGLFALVTGAAVVINSARTAAEESARKERISATKSNAVAQLLKDSLDGVGPSVALGRDTTLLKEILERASQRVDEELDDQPEVEADMRSTLSVTYWEMGEYQLAETHRRRSKEIIDKLYAGDHSAKALELGELGLILAERDEFESAEEHFRESLAMYERLNAETDDDGEVSALKDLATLLTRQNRVNEAREQLELAYRKAIAYYETEEHDIVATVISALGNVEMQAGNFAEAHQHYERALELHRRLLPADHPFIQTSMLNLGWVLLEMNQLDESEQLFRDAIALQRKVLGADHPTLASSLRQLGGVLKRAGRLDDTERVLNEALSIARQHFSEEHVVVEYCLNDLAGLYNLLGRLEQSLEIHQQLLKNKLARGDERNLFNNYNNVAHVLMRTKQFNEAEKMFREAIALAKAAGPHGSPQLPTYMNNRGQCLVAMGRFEEAIELFQQVIEMRKRLNENDPQIGNSLSSLGQVYLKLKDYEKAEELQRQAVAKYSELMGPDHLYTQICRFSLARVLRARDKLDEANKLYKQTRPAFEASFGTTHSRTVSLRAHHGALLADLGRWEEARTELEFALKTTSPEGDLVLEDRLLTKVKIWLGLVLAKLKEFEQSESLLLAAEKEASAGDEPWDEDDAPPPPKALVRLYLRWHQAEPDAGHDAKADKWRTND